jgi:hypothetical protein
VESVTLKCGVPVTGLGLTPVPGGCTPPAPVAMEDCVAPPLKITSATAAASRINHLRIGRRATRFRARLSRQPDGTFKTDPSRPGRRMGRARIDETAQQ